MNHPPAAARSPSQPRQATELATRRYLASTTRIGCDLGRAAYDCFYLALAEVLQQPLVTADMRLVHAVRTSRFAKHVLALSELSSG